MVTGTAQNRPLSGALAREPHRDGRAESAIHAKPGNQLVTLGNQHHWAPLHKYPLWSATWVARVPTSATPEREICVAPATSQLALMPK